MSYRHFGRIFLTAKFFNSPDEANSFMEQNGDYGLLAITETEPPQYVVAHTKDFGSK